jgi:hypothetical protein
MCRDGKRSDEAMKLMLYRGAGFAAPARVLQILSSRGGFSRRWIYFFAFVATMDVLLCVKVPIRPR